MGRDGLTQAQKESYRRDGFLVLPDFVPAASCDRLRARAEALLTAFEPLSTRSIFSTREQTRVSDEYFLSSGDQIRFFFEEEALGKDGSLLCPKERAINKIGHALHDLDPEFDRFSRTPELAAVVRALGYVRPLLLQSMYIFKQPGIGGEVTVHQDATFLYTDPPTATGLWFALEDADRDNGCLWAERGGHTRGLRSRFVRAAGGGTEFIAHPQPGDASDIGEPRDEAAAVAAGPDTALVPLEVKKGTLILLHGLLPHLSHANRSARSRHAYTLHVVDGTSRYPADNWLQRAQDRPARGF